MFGIHTSAVHIHVYIYMYTDELKSNIHHTHTHLMYYTQASVACFVLVAVYMYILLEYALSSFSTGSDQPPQFTTLNKLVVTVKYYVFFPQDMVNRRVSMQLMMDSATDQKGKQFIFLTPQDMRLAIHTYIHVQYTMCCVCVFKSMMKIYRNCRKMLSL